MWRSRHCAPLLLLMGFALFASAAETSTPDMLQAVEVFRIQTRELGLRIDSPRVATRQRSSGATWHGRIYWNLRNDLIDAVPHQVRQSGGDKSILRRNQYGFNVSGPVVLPWLYHGGNRTFFSFSYEGMRETSGQHYLRTIATLGERSGDFSQTLDSSGRFLPIYDPATTRPNPRFKPSEPVSFKNPQYERDPFPGNTIDPRQLDTAAMDAVGYYPSPNVSIGPYFKNNYSVYSPEVNKADGIRAELDQNIGDRHRLSLQFEYSNGFESPAKVIDNIANSTRPDRDFRNRGADLQHVFTISPATVNTIRFGASTNITENNAGLDGGGQPFPVYYIRSYMTMGASSPVSRTAYTNYGLSNGFTSRRGDHSLTVSASWNLTQANSFLPRYPSGNFDFTSDLTSLPGVVNTGHAFASFLLGMADYAEQSLIEQPSYFRRQEGEIEIEDEWQVTPDFTLTVNFGIDIQAPRLEKYDRQSTVALDEINPANGRPGAVVFAALGGRGRAFQPVRFLTGGNIGVAWSPFGGAKTVIRASAQRYRGGYGLSTGHWGTQGFIGTPTFISENSQLYPALILEDGLPPLGNTLPDLRPDIANNTTADLVEPSGRMPVTTSGSLSIAQQLPGSLTITVGGNLSRGRDRFAGNNGANPNAIPLSALEYRDLLNNESFVRELRPYPQYLGFDFAGDWPVGHYARNNGYIRVDKRTSQGLSLGFSYNFAAQHDDYNSFDGLQDYYSRANEWALSPYSSPHFFSLNYLYELPLGPDQRFLNATDWRRHFFQGWLISGFTNFSGGSPIALRAEFNNTGDVVEALYVNTVPGVDPQVANPSPDLWFNPDAFVNPPDFTIGNAPRSHPTLRNPSYQNHDLAVTKRFALYNGQSLEFIGTALNFLNHANWNDPDNEIGTADSPNTNAGKIIGSRGGRVMQLGLRYAF